MKTNKLSFTLNTYSEAWNIAEQWAARTKSNVNIASAGTACKYYIVYEAKHKLKFIRILDYVLLATISPSGKSIISC